MVFSSDMSLQSISRIKHITCRHMLQESMIGEAESLLGRKRTGGAKEILQEATKLTQKLRFLVEEVKQTFKLLLSDMFTINKLTFHFHTYTSLHCSPNIQSRTCLCGCLATTNVLHMPGFEPETYCTPATRNPEESSVGRY